MIRAIGTAGADEATGRPPDRCSVLPTSRRFVERAGRGGGAVGVETSRAAARIWEAAASPVVIGSAARALASS
jgi:hypothetical protein